MIGQGEKIMPEREIRRLSAGASQHQLRNYNERLILTLIQRHRALPGSEIARSAGLSPQTVSVILRAARTGRLA